MPWVLARSTFPRTLMRVRQGREEARSDRHAGAIALARRRRVPLRGRFGATIVFGIVWAGLSVWVDRPWATDLGGVITPAGAWVVIAGIAIVPGYLNAQLFASLILDRPPIGRLPEAAPDVTVLIAAYDEAEGIADTIRTILEQQYPGGIEPTAVAHTEVPTGLRAYVRQRQRWSRGMIEGLRLHGPTLIGQRRMVSHSIANNFLMPYLDFAYSIAIPAGLVGALRGDYVLIGPLPLAVLPVNVVVIAFMRRGQRRAFDRARLEHPRRDLFGFVCFLLAYHMITAPAACSGYLAEAAGVRKRW